MPRGHAGGGKGDQADDDSDFVEPTPKRRVLMPREASLSARAKMCGQGDSTSSISEMGDSDLTNSVPETPGGEPILPIPDYDLARGGMQSLNTSLPASLPPVHLNPGSVVDPVINGSHLNHPQTNIPSTTYQDFSRGLTPMPSTAGNQDPKSKLKKKKSTPPGYSDQ